ncbi:DUF2382 domain-containing protein [Kocuria sp.]|uniref:DUF2382 domain-containing protein n=1 Tax=Kocuria sp. TaxID=1871328 RepID=UPI0026DF191D|nr:DUF2382 domain-containing protein [Kocuria sp.]MDO5618124.1 DUF2382 domain-containing protein [Kocuria sp.]
MATFNIEELENGTLYDQDGSKVGDVAQLYLDDATGEPNWVTVNTGLFGTNETFVPLDQARVNNGEIHVPYPKDFIKDAPNLDADAHIDEHQEDELYRYYGLIGGTTDAGQAGQHDGLGERGDADGTAESAGAAGTAGAAGAAGAAGGVAASHQERDVEDDRARLGHDDTPESQGQYTRGQQAGAAGDYPDERGEYVHEGDQGQHGLDCAEDRSAENQPRNQAPGAEENSVVRHEEQVNVGTERVQTGRARLRKRVVTEQETITVPVEREEVEVINDADVADDRAGSVDGQETDGGHRGGRTDRI